MDSMHADSARTSILRRVFQPAPATPDDGDATIARPVPSIISLLLFPFSMVYRVVARVFGALAWTFPGLHSFLQRLWVGRRDAVERKTLNRRDTAARFVREFHQAFGAAAETLPFQETGYNQARDLAKRELKYLLVILISPEHDDSPSFVQSTLLDPQVIDFIKDAANNIVLWAGSVQDSEPYQVSTTLNVTKLPFAGLVAHTPSVSSSAMSLILRLPGPRSPADFVKQLKATITRHDQELMSLRLDRQEQTAARSIREQQNSAYERSLAQDRERARQRKESAAAAEKAVLEERQLLEAIRRKERDMAQWRLWRAASLAPELEVDAANPASQSRISVRTASGERLVRRFAADAPLEELYAWVDCHAIEVGAVDNVTKPDGYTHEYDFKLVSPLPRTVYEVDDPRATVGACIGRSGNLIVESIIHDEEE